MEQTYKKNNDKILIYLRKYEILWTKYSKGSANSVLKDSLKLLCSNVCRQWI